MSIEELMDVVNRQAEDDGLWFMSHYDAVEKFAKEGE